MRTGIIGDIHGCYPALTQVITKLKDHVDRWVWLGDIRGYGPDPQKCYKVAKEFTGRASNRYLVGGNHDYYFGTGELSLAGGFAIASAEYDWKNWLGITTPKNLRSATRRLDEKLIEGVKIEKEEVKQPEGWKAWFALALTQIKKLLPFGKREDYVPARDLKDIVKSIARSDKTLPIVGEYIDTERKRMQAEAYLTFFSKLQPELTLDGNLLFAHAFPVSLKGHADELGIEKGLIDTAEIYVRQKGEYDKRCAEIESAQGEVKSNEWKMRNTTMDRLIEKVPEGTTLFVGHNHNRAFLEVGDKKIVIVGAVFNRGAVEGDRSYDTADFAVHDSDTNAVTLGGIKYDRKSVDERMRNECRFGRYMRGRKQ
jgi:predicted phosphodiesterase